MFLRDDLRPAVLGLPVIAGSGRGEQDAMLARSARDPSNRQRGGSCCAQT